MQRVRHDKWREYRNYVKILKPLVASALLLGNKKVRNCKENWANNFISCLNALDKDKQDHKGKLFEVLPRE